MSRKSKKSSTGSLRKTIDSGPWVKDCKGKMINDKDFQCSVSILIESAPFYRIITEEFDKFSKFGYRKCVKCISVDLISEVLFTCCSKNGELTSFSILCDEILKHTGKFLEGKIPLDLYKYLLKYIILDLKEKRLAEMKKESLVEAEYQNKLKKYVGVAGKPNTKNSKSESTKGGKDTSKIIQLAMTKVNTNLHTRTEHLRCLDSVKDEPENGPNLYIIIIQNNHPELPYGLLKLDVPVTSLIQVGHIDLKYFDDEVAFEDQLKQNEEMNMKIKEILQQSYLDKKFREKSFVIETDVRSYWSKNLYYMNRKQYSAYFKNVDILKFIPDIPNEPKSADFINKLQRSIYDGISEIVFLSYKLRKLYSSYITQEQIDIFTDKAIGLNNLKYYNNVMDQLPTEIPSVPLILDLLISQVCLDSNSPIGYDKNNFQFLNAENKSIKNPEIKKSSCLNRLMEHLEHDNRFSDINIATITNLEDRSDSERECDVKISYNGDKIMESYHVLDKDRDEFIKSRSMYIEKIFWDSFLFSQVKISKKTNNLYKRSINESENSEIIKEILDIVLSVVNIKTDADVETVENYTADDSKPPLDYLQEILVSLDNNSAETFLDKYTVLDLVSSTTMMQNLQEALLNSSHYTIQHLPINDKLIITFYDFETPIKATAQLSTIISLRDFIEKVAEKYKFESDGMFKNKKRFNYISLMNNLQNATVNSVDKSINVICNPAIYQGNPEKWLESCFDVNLEKRCKYKYFMDGKLKEGNEYKNMENQESLVYNLDIQDRVQIDYFNMNIKLHDNLEVFLKYMDISFLEKYDLTVLTKLKKHELCFETNLLPADFMVENTDARNSNFFIRHSSGILFSFKKTSTFQFINNNGDFPNLNFLKFEEFIDLPDLDILEGTWYTFDLKISWPNGLTIKQINKPNLPIYVKQKYIQRQETTVFINLGEESYRCILNNGTVMKFMDNGTLIILHPNGKIIECKEMKENNDRPSLTINNEKLKIQKSDIFQDPRVTVSKYNIRTSDGKIRSFDYGEMTENQPLFVEDIHNVLECSIHTEFSDGVTYEHGADGSLIVIFRDGTSITSYARFAKEEFVPDFSDIIETAETIPYIIVELAFKVDHKCFASVLFDFTGTESCITMPDKIQVFLSNRININFNEDIQISNHKSGLAIREKEGNNIISKIIYSYEEFKDRKDTLKPIITFQSAYHNSLFIYENGKFDMKFMNDQLGAIQNKRIFIMGKDYNGFEIFSKYQLNRYLKSLEHIENSVIRQTKKGELVDHTVLLPLVMDKWSNFNDFLNVYKIYKKPSTYGNGWCFPLKENQVKNELSICPQSLSVRVFKEMDKMKEYIKELKIILLRCLSIKDIPSEKDDSMEQNNKEIITYLECLSKEPDLALNVFKKGTLKLDSDCEKRDTTIFIKNKLMYHTNQSLYQVNIEKVRIRFEQDKENLLDGKICSYFQCAEGNSALIIHEVLERLYEIADERNENKELEILLLTSLADLNAEDLKRVKELFTKLYKVDQEEDIDQLEKLLTAGKKLEKYFSNMNEVLKFHEEVNYDPMEMCPQKYY